MDYVVCSNSVFKVLHNYPMKELLELMASEPESDFLNLKRSTLTNEVPHFTSSDLQNYEVKIDNSERITFKGLQ